MPAEGSVTILAAKNGRNKERMTSQFELPTIRDLGTLTDVTAACQGSGLEDGAAKSDDPFIHSQPDFGDPNFCN
jgi:hypothetical protein